jgi:hypothetical protein
MFRRDYVEYCSSIIQILIDVSNLIEQLIIYFIVKQESDNNIFEERLFFFVLLIIGLFSNIPSSSPYLYIQTFGSITVEFIELLAYLFLLKKSTNVILVASISFFLELIFHSINIILEYYCNEKQQNEFIFGKTTCGRMKYVGIRLMSYLVFDATSILFLFLDENSRFHYKFYEILILLTFYFPSIALGPALESIAIFKYQYEHQQIPQITILLVWSLICATVYFTMYSIPLSITGVIFAIQQLREINKPYGYDFVVYVSSLTFFSIGILVFPPFIIWWWRFTVKRFRNMRIDAKKRFNPLNDEGSCL